MWQSSFLQCDLDFEWGREKKKNLPSEMVYFRLKEFGSKKPRPRDKIVCVQLFNRFDHWLSFVYLFVTSNRLRAHCATKRLMKSGNLKNANNWFLVLHFRPCTPIEIAYTIYKQSEMCQDLQLKMRRRQWKINRTTFVQTKQSAELVMCHGMNRRFAVLHISVGGCSVHALSNHINKFQRRKSF